VRSLNQRARPVNLEGFGSRRRAERGSLGPPSGTGGAPRMYVFSTCRRLIDQFKSAPVAVEGMDAGEIVDPKWATSHGHAIDAARYGAMSRPSPSEDEPEPDPTLEDPRAEALRQSFLRECELDESRDFDVWEDSLYDS
jgi:hypothetical protein